jgi:hypothetical protein
MTTKDAWKYQSFRPSKFELAVMDLNKILWNLTFILWWDWLLATKWYAMI